EPAQGRPALPGRAAAQLQPQVLPALAPPLLLLRALERPAARRARVPPGGGAADAAGPLGDDARSRRPVRAALVGIAVVLAALLVRGAGSATPNHDWPLFGYDTARHNVSPDATITKA